MLFVIIFNIFGVHPYDACLYFILHVFSMFIHVHYVCIFEFVYTFCTSLMRAGYIIITKTDYFCNVCLYSEYECAVLPSIWKYILDLLQLHIVMFIFQLLHLYLKEYICDILYFVFSRFMTCGQLWSTVVI